MVRYHEGGRFCEKDEEWDRESAVFHLEHAADLGELEAIVGLGLMYSQLPHHILADVSLKVRGGSDTPGSRKFDQSITKHWFGSRGFKVS
jgi:elongation factor 2 kinase